jgi:hypothetical protein
VPVDVKILADDVASTSVRQFDREWLIGLFVLHADLHGIEIWPSVAIPHQVRKQLPVHQLITKPYRSRHERDELWKGLRVTYPAKIASHSQPQDFYFGSDLLLRRHDYHVEASGGFAAAKYAFEPVTVLGVTLAPKRRACMRDPSLLPLRDQLMVSIDISDSSFL